jgi:hypothetical protein
MSQLALFFTRRSFQTTSPKVVLEQLQKWETECRDYNKMLKEPANQQISFDLDDGIGRIL